MRASGRTEERCGRVTPVVSIELTVGLKVDAGVDEVMIVSTLSIGRTLCP